MLKEHTQMDNYLMLYMQNPGLFICMLVWLCLYVQSHSIESIYIYKI